MKIYEVFKKIQETPGTNDKKQILKENVNDVIKQIFEDTFGEKKYYIKTFDVPLMDGVLTLDNDYHIFRDTLNALANRTVTGIAAWKQLFSVILEFDKESQEILCRIINRNLKIGISMDNFLDVVGGKEDKYEVALAESFAKAKGIDPTDGTYFVSQKLDGVRCICFINRTSHSDGIRTSVEFRSRQNKLITTLDKLKCDVSIFTESLGCGKFVLDGEVCIVDDNGKENFQGLMKEITRKNHTISQPKYKVFDLLTEDEFWGRAESPKFEERYNMLCELYKSYNDHFDNRYKANVDSTAYIELVIQQAVTNQEILDGWVATSKELGWEGCMLRKDAPYKRGRSKDLLKIKGMQDAEYEVIDIETGKATYNDGGHKEFDVVSAIKILHKGNVVSVGSGLSKEQRLSWYKCPEEIIGKTVTIQYFEETIDSKTGRSSLRFPVLKHVYEDGRNI